MSCSSGKITKKRIITLLVVVIGIAVTMYAISMTTNNFSILVASPLVLGLLGCPLVCGVMAGGMWLSHRLSRNKQKDTLQKNMGTCCQHDHNHHHKRDYYSNKGTTGNGKEPSGESSSTEAKGKISPNLNSAQPTSNNKSKNSS